MTQVQLAERAGLSRNTVWRLENGVSDGALLGTVTAVARVLRVAPRVLVDQIRRAKSRTRPR